MASQSFGFVVAIILIGIGFAIYAHYRSEQRKKEIAAIAGSLGMSYSQDAGPTYVAACRDFGLTHGRSARCRNLVSGNYKGVPVAFLDHSYVVSSGKSSHTVFVGVAFAWLPRTLPDLSIVPETFGLKLWDALGGEDIDFESDEFSRRFWVQSPDRKFAYDVIHPRMMEFLMAPGWDQWRLRGNMVCMWHAGLASAQEIPSLIDRASAFVLWIPDRVKGTAPAVEVPA